AGVLTDRQVRDPEFASCGKGRLGRVVGRGRELQPDRLRRVHFNFAFVAGDRVAVAGPGDEVSCGQGNDPDRVAFWVFVGTGFEAEACVVAATFSGAIHRGMVRGLGSEFGADVLVGIDYHFAFVAGDRVAVTGPGD